MVDSVSRPRMRTSSRWRRCKDRYTAMFNFVACVEAGSLVRASENIGVSPSAISVSISRLEYVVGAKLLLRTTRTMNLTREGEVFYVHAKRAVEMTQQAFESVGAGHDDACGHAD
jgi:LysR family transcriptional regulator, regulator for bpeEF and oprC